LACLVVPTVFGHDPYAVDFEQKQEGPSFAHPLGTDFFGRDLAVRLALGGRASLLVAFAAAALVLVIGLAYGSLAALAGGRTELATQRLLDGPLALPRLPILIVILLVVGLNGSLWTLVPALAITNWMITARLVRGEVATLLRTDFVRAARGVGASRRQILFRHLIPNSLGVLIVAVFLGLPAMILGESFLSVLDLGPGPPAATWGALAQDAILQGRLYELVLSSAAIAVFAVSANLVADALHQALDPRQS
ncbi:MAG TPA: ABC transporter permease, partial [Gaiellaceae bacterium]|nr:ABC transporter permease [Gaiellaceae bacterium]